MTQISTVGENLFFRSLLIKLETISEVSIEALQSESYPDYFEISIAGLPKPNGRLNAQNKLAYPDFNTYLRP